MSLQLLHRLNGNKKGAFHNWLKALNEEPRIAWYPSAGEDFRPLMFLHPSSTQLIKGEPQFPNIFLFTDYFPWKDSTFLDSKIIYQDEETKVTVEELEMLPDLTLPLDPEIVHFPEGSHATNKVVFLNVKISSNKLGNITYPVLYAFAENETFFSEILLPNNALISHILRIRYGGGMGGGGYARGTWLLHVLGVLKTKELIADNHDIGIGIYNEGTGDRFFLEQHPSIPRMPCDNLEPIRTTPSEKWSKYGDVIWYLVNCQ
jgi:hypothetical protein